MTFYFAMINSWSLAWEVLNGTMDETYPIREDIPEDLWNKKIGVGNTATESSAAYFPSASQAADASENDGLDYEVDLFNGASADYLADIDDQRAHHFTNANSPYNDGWTQEFHQKELDKMDYEPKTAHYYKYHEEEILKDIEEYVSRTYQGHYTGNSHEFRNVQTLDLMAAKELASSFCQANILKYGSRYGNKDGRNTKDLMKVIHYAMLLLHFDGHYGKPSMSTGNIDEIDHNMP